MHTKRLEHETDLEEKVVINGSKLNALASICVTDDTTVSIRVASKPFQFVSRCAVNRHVIFWRHVTRQLYVEHSLCRALT